MRSRPTSRDIVRKSQQPQQLKPAQSEESSHSMDWIVLKLHSKLKTLESKYLEFVNHCAHLFKENRSVLQSGMMDPSEHSRELLEQFSQDREKIEQDLQYVLRVQETISKHPSISENIMAAQEEVLDLCLNHSLNYSELRENLTGIFTRLYNVVWEMLYRRGDRKSVKEWVRKIVQLEEEKKMLENKHSHHIEQLNFRNKERNDKLKQEIARLKNLNKHLELKVRSSESPNIHCFSLENSEEKRYFEALNYEKALKESETKFQEFERDARGRKERNLASSGGLSHSRNKCYTPVRETSNKRSVSPADRRLNSLSKENSELKKQLEDTAKERDFLKAWKENKLKKPTNYGQSANKILREQEIEKDLLDRKNTILHNKLKYLIKGVQQFLKVTSKYQRFIREKEGYRSNAFDDEKYKLELRIREIESEVQDPGKWSRQSSPFVTPAASPESTRFISTETSRDVKEQLKKQEKSFQSQLENERKECTRLRQELEEALVKLEETQAERDQALEDSTSLYEKVSKEYESMYQNLRDWTQAAVSEQVSAHEANFAEIEKRVAEKETELKSLKNKVKVKLQKNLEALIAINENVEIESSTDFVEKVTNENEHLKFMLEQNDSYHENKIKELSENIENLEEERENYLNKIKDLEGEVSELKKNNSRISELQNQIKETDELQSKLNSLQKEHFKALKEVKEKDLNLEQLEYEKKVLQEENKVLTESDKLKEEQLMNIQKQLKEEISKANERIEGLVFESTSYKSKCDQLSKEIAEKNQELTDLSENYRKKSSDEQALRNSENSKLLQEVQQLKQLNEAAHSNSEKQNITHQETVSKLNKTIEELQNHSTKVDSENTQLKESVQKQTEQCETLQKQCSDLETQVANLQFELQSALEKYSEFCESNFELISQKLTDKEAALKNLKRKIKLELKKSLQELISMYESISQPGNTEDSESENLVYILEQNKVYYENKIEELSEIIETLEQERESYSSKISEQQQLHQRLSEQEKKCSELQVKLQHSEELEKELQTAKTLQVSAEKQLKEKELDLEELQYKLKALEEDKQALENSEVSKDNRIMQLEVELKSQINEANSKIEHLVFENSSYKSQIEKLSAEENKALGTEKDNLQQELNALMDKFVFAQNNEEIYRNQLEKAKKEKEEAVQLKEQEVNKLKNIMELSLNQMKESYELEIHHKNEEITKLHFDIENLQQNQDVETQLKQLTAKNQSLQQENLTLESQVGKLNKELNRTTKQLKEREVYDLEEKLIESQEKIAELECLKNSAEEALGPFFSQDLVNSIKNLMVKTPKMPRFPRRAQPSASPAASHEIGNHSPMRSEDSRSESCASQPVAQMEEELKEERSISSRHMEQISFLKETVRTLEKELSQLKQGRQTSPDSHLKDSFTQFISTLPPQNPELESRVDVLLTMLGLSKQEKDSILQNRKSKVQRKFFGIIKR